MRLFIAVDLSEEMKDQLEQYIIGLKKKGAAGNFSRRANLHITLSFIGETDKQGAAEAALSRINFTPFKFRLTEAGRFPGRNGDTVYIGIDSSGSMEKLAEGIRNELIREGFVLENRKFTAHLTLGREIRGYDKIKDSAVPSLEGEVKELSLMKSERINGVLKYTPIYIKR